MISFRFLLFISFLLIIALLQRTECKSVDVRKETAFGEEIFPRQDDSEEGGGEEETDELPVLTPEDAKILRMVINKQKVNNKDTANESELLQALVALDSKEIEAALKDAKRESEQTKKLQSKPEEGTITNTTTATGKPPLAKATVTTKKPQPQGIVSRLRQMFRNGNFNRKSLLRLMMQTRKTVEYLEDIGIVNELATPVLIADDVFSVLEGIVG